MTILEYQRESPWAHKRRTRRMATDIMPRSLERPIVIAAVITAVMAWLTLASWATAEGGQARMTVAVEPGSTLTIRAEPNRDSRSRGALTAGTAVIVLEQRDGWALVDWPVMAESWEASATRLNGAACEPQLDRKAIGEASEGVGMGPAPRASDGHEGSTQSAPSLNGAACEPAGMGWVCMDYLADSMAGRASQRGEQP